MTECVAGRDNIEVNKNKLEGKNADMENGRRSTMSTILKKDNDPEAVKNKMVSNGQDISDMDVLLKLITIHLGETVIPQFKREKLDIYTQMMQALSIMEINNAHVGATFFSAMLKNKNLKKLR